MFLRCLINRHLLISLSCIAFFSVEGQEFSARGKDFWAGYGAHISMYDSLDGSVKDFGGTQSMVLYFSAVNRTNVRVEIPGTGWYRDYIAKAGSVTESDPIPKKDPDDARLAREGVFNRGIHITSDEPILVYCHIYDNSISGASLIFPTTALGQDYTVLGFTQESNNDFSYSFCFIIATEDSTIVEVTPSENTLAHKKGEAFTQMLQKGEVLNLLGELTHGNDSVYRGVDLTGTRIRAIADSAHICKKIAVFCGTAKTAIRCSARNLLSSDNMIQQAVPSDCWGKKYISVPTKGMPFNFFRIMVKDSATVVTRNGIQLTNLINGLYYEVLTNEPSVFLSDQDIMVAQYITTINKCGNNSGGDYGDPEITYLTPVNETINNLSVISPSNYAIVNHFINVMIKTNGISSFLLDGTKRPGAFNVVQFDNTYSYAQFTVTAGIHQLSSDSGFNALVYGYGNHESYGYNAGFTTGQDSAHLSIENPLAISGKPQTCDSTPFSLSVTLSYRAANLYWDFLNNPTLSPNQNLYIDNPSPDSIYSANGYNYYVYKFPGIFIYSLPEDFDLKVTAAYAAKDGCFNLQTINYTVKVFKKPIADWSLSKNPCGKDTLHFMDNSNGYQKTIMQWKWDFGDGETSNIKNPDKFYANYGDQNIALRVITDIGCFADTIKSIHLSDNPKADFSISGNNCFGNLLSFTDHSTFASDSIVKWNWDFGDNTFSDLQNPTRQYSTSESFNIRLTVYNTYDCEDDIIKQFTVYSIPEINIDPEVAVIENNSLTLQPVYSGTGLKYKWSPPVYLNSDTIPFPVTRPKDDILYNITVTGDGGCSSSKNVFVNVIQILHIPNVFSPNGDGINDKWIITNIDKYPQCTIEIFNRYGQQLFYSVGYGKPWDGTYNDQPLPVGTYYYIINTHNNYLPVYKGYILVLR